MSYSNDYSQKTRIHDMEIIIKQLYRHTKKWMILGAKAPEPPTKKEINFDQLNLLGICMIGHKRLCTTKQNHAAITESVD